MYYLKQQPCLFDFDHMWILHATISSAQLIDTLRTFKGKVVPVHILHAHALRVHLAILIRNILE